MNPLKLFFYSTFLLVVFSSCKSESEKLAEENAMRKAIIDNVITQFQKNLLTQQIDSVFSKSKFNGSISVMQNDKILYEKYNGFENFKTKTPLDSNSVFAIGSVSKQITAVMILLLEEQGKLKVEDQVSKFLKEFQSKTFENITIAQLLNHTSGLNDSGSGLLSKPGTKFNYSNKGYRYLGQLIEKISGKKYGENAKELFAKAGMKHSSTSDLFVNHHFSSEYLGNSSRFQEVENMPKRLSNIEISVGAGGVLSTVSDLHQWNFALYNGKILKPESLRKFMTNSTENNHPILGKVGYGFGIMMNEGKPGSYFHTGYVKGSPSLNIYYPETKTSVVILSNIADEAKGKNAVFNPHKEVKKINEVVENALIETQRKLH